MALICAFRIDAKGADTEQLHVANKTHNISKEYRVGQALVHQ
jgi:hypothetical protein